MNDDPNNDVYPDLPNFRARRPLFLILIGLGLILAGVAFVVLA